MSKQGRDALAQVPLFSDLPPRFIRRLADRMQEERFMEGATVVRQDEPGETFYVILQGEAKVIKDDSRTIARLLPGDFFGEISLMDGGPRTATIKTATPLTALTLSRKDFRSLLESEPKVTARLLKHAAALLRRMERPPSG